MRCLLHVIPIWFMFMSWDYMFFYVFKSIKFWIYVIQSIMLILLFIFFLLAVMWHDSYLPFLFQPKIWCCKKKYTKMTKYLLGFILLFVEVFCYNNWGLYMANIFTSWQTIGKINLFLIQVFFFNMKTE